MSVSFGALGILAVRTSLLDFVLGDGQLRSVLGAFLSVFVIIVLAYLTNPTENSFRTYLTEQSFRQHLSRLDESSDDGLIESDNPKAAIRRSSSLSGSSTSTSSSETGPSSPSAPDHNSSQFHFANRASVSLRTPKHAFNSFGIFTIAAVIPIARHNNSSEESSLACSDPALIPDSWFIGAFGKWWRGGLLEAWYHGIVPNSKDEEGWSSGILGIKALDRRNDFNGLPFTTQAAPPLRSVGVAPKLRNRDRSQPRQKDQGDSSSSSSSHHHSNKTSLLPLHAPRATAPSSIQPHLSSNNNNNNNNNNSVLPVPSPVSKANSTDAAPRLNYTNSNNAVLPLSRTPSSIAASNAASVIDKNPSVIDLLRQISQSKSTTAELRTQLADFQSTASAAHAALQADVDACRERKKTEDAAKAELKTRTKVLDDQRRAHEAARRDAEKRLRAAQTQREHASARMASLDKEIGALERRLAEEEERAEKERGELKESEKEIGETLKMKRKEIAVAEDVVAALGVRAKELEEMIAREKERLRVAKEKAEMRRQDESFIPRMAKPAQQQQHTWPPVSQQQSSPVLSEATIATSGNNGTPSSAPAEEVRSDPQRSPRPGLLSLSALSNFSLKRTPPQFDPIVVAAPQPTASSLNSTSTATTTGSSIVSSPGFAPFDHGSTTSSLLTSPSTTTQASQPISSTMFSPFDLDTPSSASSNGSDNSSGSNTDAVAVGAGVTSSLSGTTLIPSGLIQSLDGKSTSTENVAALARWDTRASDSIAITPASASAARRRWFDHQRGSRSSNSSSNSGGGHGSDNGAPGAGVGAHQLVNQVSRSFQSDNDVFLEPDWRVRANAGNGAGTGTAGLVTASPTSYTGPVSSFDDEVYAQGQQQRRSYGSGSSGGFGSASATTTAVDDFGFLMARGRRSSLDADQTLAFGGGLNSQAVATVVPKAATVGAVGNGKDSIARRWYSVLQSSSGADKEAKGNSNNNNTSNGSANSNKEPKASSKKGLNPDAKVFRLTRKKSLPSSAPPPASSLTYPGPIGSKPGQQQPFDLLNPTSLVSPSSVATAATTSTSSLLLRAFAPSPAEREALQRALGGGGSTNASLERLPSLSDVGSIPPSPELAARGLGLSSHHPHPQQTRVGGGNGLGTLPAWLHPFQRAVKKPAFSPWDDDEPVVPPAKTANSSF